MKIKKILISSTKSMTINLFLDEIIHNAKNKYELFFLCSDPENIDEKIIKNLENNRVKIILFKNYYEFLNIYKFISIIFKIRKHIKNNKFDIIFTHTPLISHLLRISTFGMNLNICYFVHGFRFYKKSNFFIYYSFYILEKILSFNTSSYITINNEDSLLVKKNFKKKQLKINGVGINFNYNKISQLNLNNKIKIGVIAAYRKNKGYDELLKIAKNYKNINFLCYGYDDFQYYKDKSYIDSITNIFFYPFTKDIYKKIDNFHFLLSLSKREGLPTSVIECLHRGKPVIGYNIRGINDLIIDNYNGCIVNYLDINQIKKKIDYLLHDEMTYYQMCKNSIKSINKKFDKKNNAIKIINFLVS